MFAGRSKFQFIFPFVLGLSLFVVLLLVAQPFLGSAAVAQVSGTPEPMAYLPLVLRDGTLATPTPQPIEPGVLWIEQGTIAISSYQYDHPDCLVTLPSDHIAYPYPGINHDCVFQKPILDRTFNAITLHNSYVAVTVLPELGGRLYRWQDKVTGRQLLYANPVLKPTAWGGRGWWLASGGIEWAFPTDEHGLNEYRPWDTTTEVLSDTVSITVSDVEDQTGMTVGVTISLDGDHNYMTLEPFVMNDTAVSHNYQYWLNAMIALGDNTTNDATEFIVPAAQVQVHSRDANASYLPNAGEWMNWPEHNGRFFHIYGDWTHYLGFFAPNLSTGFTGVYDHTAQQGIVRVFDETQMPGNKFFGPANLEPHLYTNDDTVYVEMWSSGVTPDFWTYVSLDAGQSKQWLERWYPVHNLGSFDMANEFGALRLDETETGAEIGLQVTAVTSGMLSLLVDGVPVANWPGPFLPDQPVIVEWERPFGLTGAISLQFRDELDQVLLSYAP
ncbi:DUF5107 domain-containing protein [Candidatus Leptofilum sp.]|uniref:DUF5107 domain-containing protein n=1 Tax=Candidatus Leptofilum sp. TaxID=3241576 RepID=UPI003B5C7C74